MFSATPFRLPRGKFEEKMANNAFKLFQNAKSGGLIGLAVAGAYGLYKSVYTGIKQLTSASTYFTCFLVDGGYRAVVFSRISGVQKLVKTEGLHFRYRLL